MMKNSDNKINYIVKSDRPIVYRCDSCGAPIRDGDSYHELTVEGVKLSFCTFCVGLSEFIADRGDQE